jgi:predicted ABC-type transport system involved in lysophospholipase L1 biosynthesis ATPase subunit
VTAVLELSAISKDYHGLRPLRIERLVLAPGDEVAIVGIDQLAAEVLINLMTGASLPDRGQISAFGRGTASIDSSSEWLSLVDRFGIVTDRAVLLDELSTLQNLAIPFSLEIESMSRNVRRDAERLAREAGIDERLMDAPVKTLEGEMQARIRLARALALDPEVLLCEHPTATLQRPQARRFGRDLRRIAEGRGLTTLSLTADLEFARAAAIDVLMFHPATGGLARRRFW